MSLAVSLVTYHAAPEPGFVEGLLAQAQPLALRVLVNEARDGEVEDVREALRALPVELVAAPTNTGFAGGHNANCEALFAKGADAVLVLNPDVRLQPGALTQLWRTAGEHGGRCLVGPLLELGDGPEVRGTGLIDSTGIRWTRTARHLDVGQGRPLAEAPTAVRRVRGLTGACLLVPRRAWEEVVSRTGELFDADFVAYREDAELGLRAQALDLPCLLDPVARAVHARGLRGTSRHTSAHINRLGVQNRFLMLAKHGRRRPGLLPLSVGRDLVVLLAAGLRERSSWPGVVRAWQLRHRMADKRRRIYGAGR